MYKRIKEIADKKKIQQKEIAEALDVGPNTVNNWFHGNTSMKAEQIPLLAKILRVSIDQLFQEVGTPLMRTFGAEEKFNVVEEPCQNCERLKIKIEGLQAILVSKDETIAALRGDHKKEKPFTSDQKAG